MGRARYDELMLALGKAESRWRPALARLVDDRLIERFGAGKRGEPYRFRKVTAAGEAA